MRYLNLFLCFRFRAIYSFVHFCSSAFSSSLFCSSGDSFCCFLPKLPEIQRSDCHNHEKKTEANEPAHVKVRTSRRCEQRYRKNPEHDLHRGSHHQKVVVFVTTGTINHQVGSIYERNEENRVSIIASCCIHREALAHQFCRNILTCTRTVT